MTDPNAPGGELARLRAEDALLYQLARENGRARLALGEAAARFAERDGPGALGFSTRDGYARQRLSRTGRWTDDAARLATRLGALPRIRAALVSGDLDWWMAELVARHATPETEAERLALALVPGVTVHAMRNYLKHGDPEQDAEGDPCRRRCTVEQWMPFEQAALIEATRMLFEQMCGGDDFDWFEHLLAEAMATLPELFEPQVVERIGRELDRAEQRIADGIERRARAEELAEDDLPRNARERGDFPEPDTLPDDVHGLDALMRRTAMQLASRDLLLGRVASDFFRSKGWKKLGYATDTQYCRERLGMSRGAVWERITLARRCERLPALAEAVGSMELGFEAARLVARIATPRTERAWIERAGARTFKLLQEEVRATEARVRLGEVTGDPWPPTDQDMVEHEGFERDVLSGELVGEILDRHANEHRDAKGSEPVQISAGRTGPDSQTAELGRRIARAVEKRCKGRSTGLVRVGIRTNEEVARYFRVGRERYRELGLSGSLLLAMCVWFWETWIHELRAELTRWDAVHRRDRSRCASPGCLQRLCTLHHILGRMLGGDDRWTNLLTLCPECHLRNVHERGSLQVFGEAPNDLTFVFGIEPFMVVRGREMRAA